MLRKSPMNPKYPRLFQTGYIGRLQLKNRLVKAATVTGLAGMDGCVTERLIRHYAELARGGAGLITTGATYIDDIASEGYYQLGVSRNEHRPGLMWLADTIKVNGARACLQLHHCGIQRTLRAPPIKSASRIPWAQLYAGGAPFPEELTFEEIREIVKAFGNAALRAKQAGFDMIEVHGGHGYLVTDFLSPHYNKRTDWYGGSLTNRMRFLLEIVADIRTKIGHDYPLSIRLSGSDYEEEDPITIDETKEVAKALEKAGVNVLHMSGGDHQHIDKESVSAYWPLAYNVWAAEEVKKVVKIPVIASGAITSPELAEKILEEGKGDFIGMGRPLLADPYFPQKAQEGRPEDICPCIRCCDCTERGVKIGSINCAVNVAVGKEEQFRIAPAAKRKKVAVVGGGPAGMEAARVAALKGHEVTLFEKRKLGGMLIEASTPDFKADIRRLIDYLSTQVKKAGVKIVEGEATSQTIKDGEFEVVIVATGSTPSVPDVPGLSKPFVIGALDVLHGAQTGKDVIVVGGGLPGCDIALFQAEQGKRVTIVEMMDEIAQHMSLANKLAFFERLYKQEVEIRTGVRLEEIVDGGIVVSDRVGGRSEIKSDSVVLAVGLTPNRKLFDELAQVPGLEAFAVGGCAEPGKMIYDAIHEGYGAAFVI